MADPKSLLRCICLFGCLWSYAVTQSPEILVPPEPQLVPSNLDAMVTFSCTVRGFQLIWQVNTAQLVTDDDIMDAENLGIFPDDTDNGDGTLSGTLRINVSVSNMVNMTRILCIAVGSSTLIRNESDLVNLTTFDAPEPPRNFLLTLSNSPNTLTIRWDPPTNTPPNVPTTHTVEVVNNITGMAYPTFPQRDLMLDTTSLTFDQQNTSCTPFLFRVTATNDAGTSGPSVMTETIPISPDVTPINNFLSAQNGITVSFSSGEVAITLIFQRAQTCSMTNFPIMMHTININIPESTSTFETSDRSDIITVTLNPMNVPSLRANTLYMISVTASNGITMRTSEIFPVYTTDVQDATVDYIDLDNRVFLTCTFATGSMAQGCIFIFTLRNESERFSIAREAGTQCNTTINSAEAYDTVRVVDWESDGSEGTLARTVQPVLAEDERRFSGSCSLPDSGLSGGQIAGIVIGVFLFVLLVAAIVVVVIVVYFKTRKNTEYGEEDDKKHFWINLPGVHMSSVVGVKPGEGEEFESEVAHEATPLASPFPPEGAHGDVIPMGAVSTGDTSGEEIPRNPLVHADSVTADMGMAVSPGSPPPSLLPGTATVYTTEKSYGGPLSTLRSIDSATGTSVRPQKVGEMDLSNSKNMKIRLNPRIVRKVLKRRSGAQDDTKKLLLYAE